MAILDWTAAARDMGAALIYAPKTTFDPLKNLGTLSLPNGELKNGAALAVPGPIPGGAAASLNGTTQYIDTGWATRTNYVQEPSFEAALSAVWGSGGGSSTFNTFERSKTWAADGEWSLHVKATATANGATPRAFYDNSAANSKIPVVPGEKLSALGTINVITLPKEGKGRPRLTVRFRNAAKTEIISDISTAPVSATGITALSQEVTVPAGAAWAEVQVGSASGFTGMDNGEVLEFYLDCVMLGTPGTYLPTQADLASGLAGWSGTANASASDIGPFARGTDRTIIASVSRTNADGALFAGAGTTGGAATRVTQLLLREATIREDIDTLGSQLEWTPPVALSTPTQLGWVWSDAANTATIYTDGTSLGTKEETEVFPTGQTLRIGARGIGGGETQFLKGLVLPFAVFTRALRAEEIQELGRRSLPTQPGLTKPPLELDCEIETHDGSLYRWDPTSKLAANRPQGLNSSTQRGEGFGPGGAVLTRQVMKDYPDLGLLDTIRFIGKNGEVAYEGRIHDFSRTNDPMQQFAISSIGWFGTARFRKFSEIYIDCDLSKWGAPGPQQSLELLSAGRPNDAAISAGFSAGTPQITITLELEGPGYRRGEQWYYGGGVKLGALLFDFLGSGLDEAWEDVSGLAPTDHNEGGLNVSPDYNQVTTLKQRVDASGAAKYFAFVVTDRQAGFGAQTSVAHSWANLKVLGINGLALSGAWPNVGPVVSDVLAHIFNNFTPLTWAGESTTYPVKQAAFQNVYPLDAALTLNDLHLWEIGCFENKEVFYHPADLTTFDWQVRTDDPGVRFNPLQGDSIDGFANGVEVTYTDFTGRTHTLYPDDHADLRDETETNPANLWGDKLWKDFTVPYPTTEEDALQMGRAYLAEYNRPKSPGTITISGGYIQDAAGHWQQAWKPRCGETIALTDHPNDAPRLITSTPSWDQDAKMLTISVDNGYALLEAFLARMANAREATNLTS